MARTPRVAVMGGGVAGLTAAHELAERGFAVHVFENRKDPGGKARSIWVEGTGADGRLPLSGEHGFRLFAGFYRHVVDTMGRIPFGQQTVAENLVAARTITIARDEDSEIVLPAHFPVSPHDLALVLKAAFGSHLGLSVGDFVHLAQRLLTLMAASDQRRYAEYEHQSWWEFSGAPHRSDAFQTYLAAGLTRTLVAAQAREMSARTGGLILVQLLSDLLRFGKHVDRVLCGPTSTMWIDPWVAHLRSLGVEFHFDSRVTEVVCADNRIEGIKVRTPASSHGPGPKDPEPISFDWYVGALPLEIMTDAILNDHMTKADPGLAELKNIERRWMNGVQYFIREDLPMDPGHFLYIDSEWALTSISQHQFWPDVQLAGMGDGQVRGIISLCVSDWFSQGGNGKIAMECSREEILDEVWRQLRDACPDGGLPEKVDGHRVRGFLDPAIEWPNPTQATNLEPLFINSAGSWKWRPDAVTGIENFFLAGDYVRTNTDLATMEGANESARRAVNGILDATGSSEPRCDVWRLHEPLLLKPVRTLDRIWVELRPHLLGARA